MNISWKGMAAAAVGGAALVGTVAALWPSEATAEEASAEEEQQRTAVEPIDAELAQNERRLAINRGGMLTLLGWSAANIGVGAVGWATADGKWRYFHQMNVLWNTVNAAIGGFGYWQATSEDPRGLSDVETVDKARQMQMILLLNAGLDVGYIAGGAWMRERGLRRSDQRWIGYGESVMLQGAFLFAFDVALWAIHEGSLGKYRARIEPTGRGVVLSVDF
jgi:hypothetical protein